MSLKDKEETSRSGTKWLLEEDTKLIEEISKNISYDEIALEHKRTITAIKARVISHIIYPIFKEGTKTIDEISIEYKINKETINKYINKLDTIKSIDINISFEKRLQNLEDKLDHIISLLINKK